MSHKAFDTNLEQMIKWQEEFAKKIDPAIFEQSAAMKDLLQQIKFPKVDLSSTTDAFRHYYQQRYDFEQALEPIKIMCDNIKSTLPAITAAGKHIISLQSSSTLMAASALIQYANSVRNLTAQLDLESLQNTSFDTQIQEKTIESWCDSATEIADDMVKVGWITEAEKPVINKPILRDKPFHEQLVIVSTVIVNFIAITIFIIDKVVPFVSNVIDDITPPPAIHRELTEGEIELLTRQSQLNISVSETLPSYKPENPPPLEQENIDD